MIINIINKFNTSCRATKINLKGNRYQPWSLELNSKVRRKFTNSLLVKSRHILTNMTRWLYGKRIEDQNDNSYLYRHLRDLASGTKRIVKSNSVKFIAIPHYDGLAVKHLLLFARNYPDVMNTLPIEKEIQKLTR